MSPHPYRKIRTSLVSKIYLLRPKDLSSLIEIGFAVVVSPQVTVAKLVEKQLAGLDRSTGPHCSAYVASRRSSFGAQATDKSTRLHLTRHVTAEIKNPKA